MCLPVASSQSAPSNLLPRSQEARTGEEIGIRDSDIPPLLTSAATGEGTGGGRLLTLAKEIEKPATRKESIHR